MRNNLSKFMQGININKKILEIGPLSSPIFTKSEANVYYADIRDTNSLIEFYKNDTNINYKEIVNIDYVIGDKQYSSIINDTFDYIVSSHVLEHIPRLIDFFQDIAKILTPRGKLYAVLPDHRFCFDHFRDPTSFGELFYIHTTGIKNNPISVINHFSQCTSCNDPYILFNEKNLSSKYINKNTPEIINDFFYRAYNGEYIDVHFSTFTPYSFTKIIYNLLKLRLTPFTLYNIIPTEQNDFSFGVILEKNNDLLHNNNLLSIELSKISNIMDKLYKHPTRNLYYKIFNNISYNLHKLKNKFIFK